MFNLKESFLKILGLEHGTEPAIQLNLTQDYVQLITFNIQKCTVGLQFTCFLFFRGKGEFNFRAVFI